jgi:hypothetical protein
MPQRLAAATGWYRLHEERSASPSHVHKKNHAGSDVPKRYGKKASENCELRPDLQGTGPEACPTYGTIFEEYTAAAAN